MVSADEGSGEGQGVKIERFRRGEMGIHWRSTLVWSGSENRKST